MDITQTPPKKSSSIIEIVIVMGVIALILSIVIPNFKTMQQEGAWTKVDGDLDTIKFAVTTYWRNNSQAYPANVHSALTGTSPAIISKVLSDPWSSDSSHNTYGYIKGTDTTFGDYFIIYTKGPQADTTPSWDATNQRVNYSGSGRVVSNAPIQKD